MPTIRIDDEVWSYLKTWRPRRLSRERRALAAAATERRRCGRQPALS